MFYTPFGWRLVQRGGVTHLRLPERKNDIPLRAFAIHTDGKSVEVYGDDPSVPYLLESDKMDPACFSGRGYNFVVEFIIWNMRRHES